MIIPVSLVAIEQLWLAVYELALFLDDVCPKAIRLGKVCGQEGLTFCQLVGWFREVWCESRSYGRWQPMQVETEELQVNIEFF